MLPASGIVQAVAKHPPITLRVPASLRYRDVAVRSITAACHLIGNKNTDRSAESIDLQRTFDGEFVSAFSEIFNNIAIHAYRGSGEGEINLTMTPSEDQLLVEITDSGSTFDIESVPPPPDDDLPEGGMGIHIARACLDELFYKPGPPNVWRLTKSLPKTNSQEE